MADRVTASWAGAVLMASRYARQHRYAKRMRLRWRAAGACVRCGVPCERNPATRKPYSLCYPHRIEQSSTQRRNYQNRARTKARQVNRVNGKWLSLVRPQPGSVAQRFKKVEAA